MTEITAGAAYDAEWHVYLTCPTRGPLCYCTGVGPDEDFDPAAATQVLAKDGWKVTKDGWRETPPEEEYQYVALVVRAP